MKSKICERCKTEYLAARSTSRYCSSNCRLADFRERRKEQAKPTALDLYCAAGGVCVGLQRAGFNVDGIDIEPQPDYPGRFIQGDALNPPVNIMDYDIVWASPPCQGFSLIRTPKAVTVLEDLIQPTRDLLGGHPMTVIENVPGAPLRADLALDGRHFNLPVPRRRIFEMSFPCAPPLPIEPARVGRSPIALYGKGPADPAQKKVRLEMGLPPQPAIEELEDALGVYHIVSGTKTHRRYLLCQAIPPVYSEWIGLAAITVLNAS